VELAPALVELQRMLNHSPLSKDYGEIEDFGHRRANLGTKANK